MIKPHKIYTLSLKCLGYCLLSKHPWKQTPHRLGKILKLTTTWQTHAHEDQKVFKGCNGAKDKVGTNMEYVAKSQRNRGAMGNKCILKKVIFYYVFTK